jgi:hypothetical protein
LFFLILLNKDQYFTGKFLISTLEQILEITLYYKHTFCFFSVFRWRNFCHFLLFRLQKVAALWLTHFQRKFPLIIHVDEKFRFSYEIQWSIISFYSLFLYLPFSLFLLFSYRRQHVKKWHKTVLNWLKYGTNYLMLLTNCFKITIWV